jgi:hypothetical protein
MGFMRTLYRSLLALSFLVPACSETPDRPPVDGGGGSEIVTPPDAAPDRELNEAGLPVIDLRTVDLFVPPDAPPVDPTKDTDGDGLPDSFETLAGLDPGKQDSDGDKILDGAEDEDGDGLTAAEEWAAWSGVRVEWQKPSPKHKDLFVELDYQVGKAPSATVLSKAIEAFAAIDVSSPDGSPGIALHIFVDEKDLPVQNMTDDLNLRLTYLGAHGPKNLTGKHVAKMVHVIFTAANSSYASRGGETVGSNSQPAEKAGAFIYLDNLGKIFPVCAIPGTSKISLEEGTISTLVHELGHTLQLGHDTAAGGGVNAYNVMSTDLGECDLLHKRTRGTGNQDPALGATEKGGGPRFSKAAAALIKLKNKISVETNKFETASGYEM